MSVLTLDRERRPLIDQALSVMVGEQLGQGAYRRVYALKHDPTLVLKIEYAGELNNAEEWNTWHALVDTPWAKWLAPCVDINEFNGAMLQRRAAPLTDEQWAGLQQRPNFLQDCGVRRNWGWLDGRPVVVDYAINDLRTVGIKGIRMRGHVKVEVK